MDNLRRQTARLASVFLFAATADLTAAQLDDFDNSVSLADAHDLLAFVGEKIATSSLDEESLAEAAEAAIDEGGTLSHYSIRARYKIIDLLHGHFDGATIDFEAFDHFGTFEFVHHPLVILYLLDRDGRLVHADYQYDPVYPTSDGRFAFCGDPYSVLEDEGLKIDRRPLTELNFDAPVVLKIDNEDLKRKYGENYFSEPAFIVDGDEAICRMGVDAAEIFRVQNETIFKPWFRAEACEEKLSAIVGDLDSEEDFEAIDACIKELEAEGG